MEETALQGAGLTKNESKVYLSIVKLGSASAGQITEKTGVHRRNVYDAIERLLEKGLAGYVIKNKRKYFEATNPERLLEIIKEKEQKLKQIIPELLLAKTLSKKVQEVTIYRGRQGIITIFEDILRAKKTNLVFGTERNPSDLQGYVANFHEKRVKAKIVDRIIFSRAEYTRGRELSKKPYTQIKFMPKSYNPPIAINIYSDKVALLVFSDKYLGILIRDAKVAKSFRDYFKYLWSIAKEK